MYSLDSLVTELESSDIHIKIQNPKHLDLDKSYFTARETPMSLQIIADESINNDKMISSIKNYCIDRCPKIKDFMGVIAKLDRIVDNNRMVTEMKEESWNVRIDRLISSGYDVTGEWISWNSYIPITIVLYENKVIKVNPLMLKNLGYGIRSFRLMNRGMFIGGIYGYGDHPNLNNKNNKFCYEPILSNCSVTLEFLTVVKGSMSQINLSKSYEPELHKEKLLKILGRTK